MKLYDGTLIIIGIVIIVAAIGYISSKKMGNDNKIEQQSEAVIESLIGIKVDLSPDEKTGGFIQDIDLGKIYDFDDIESKSEIG